MVFNGSQASLNTELLSSFVSMVTLVDAMSVATVLVGDDDNDDPSHSSSPSLNLMQRFFLL